MKNYDLVLKHEPPIKSFNFKSQKKWKLVVLEIDNSFFGDI
jgi:hypothetical protein